MKRVVNGPAMLHPATPAAPVHFRRVRVLLLDKKEMFVKVENKNARVLQIFHEVCESLNLKETDLFGLALLRDNEYFFVHMDTKLQKLAPKMWGQKEGADEPSLTFLFRVMYYVHEVRLLKYRTTRHLYYLQLKENFLTYNLSISEEKCFLLSAYALITDHGPYKAELHSNSEYFKPQDYLPSWVIMRRGLDYMSANLPNMHRDMSSEALSRDARLIFITELSSLPCSHNFHLYRVTRKKYDETDNFSLAIGPVGLHVHEGCNGFLAPTASFPWSTFPKFNCDRKKFEVTCGVNNEIRLSCFTRSKEWCVHLRNLCKATQKFQQTINPRLAELKHQEDRDAGWWPEKYVPSDLQDDDRAADKSRENGTRRRIAGNGTAFDHRSDDPKRVVVAASVSVSSTDTAPSIDEGIEPNAANPNVDALPEISDRRNGLLSGSLGSLDERKCNICLSLKSLEAVGISLEVKNGVSETMNQVDNGETMQSKSLQGDTLLEEQNDHRTPAPITLASNLTESDMMAPVLKKSLEELNFDDLNLMENEILIDTPPNSDSQNITTVTPLSSNLSPFDQCLALGTPKNTGVYRHTSYLGTPLSPYLYNNQHQPQQQQQQQQLHQSLLHHHPITRHPTGNSGQQSLFWRASCSGRLMKRHLRSLECAPVHSSEQITNLVPLQNYVGHCMYKSTPLSVYSMPVYHQNSINNLFSYSQENNTGSGMLNESLQKNSIEENVGDVESEDCLEEVDEAEEVSHRPPPPAYEDVAKNSKMRLASGSRGLEFESDEFIGREDFESDRPPGGSYSDFNWATGSSSPELPDQPQPPSILDFQFPLLGSVEDYGASVPVQQPQQHRRPFEFQPSDLLPDRRFPFHRSSLNSYEQWMQHHHHHHLQAFQVQPQKIKAVSPLFAEQVQLSTPLLNRKNFQVFEQMPCSSSPQDLKVPGTKTLRKASSTESEPGEMATKERGRGKPVQRHHSNITYLRDYKNSEDSKLSFPLVNALLKDPSLQQNVRSFPSNLAALVCDGESQQT